LEYAICVFEDDTPWYLVEKKRRWAVFLIALVIMGVVWHFSTGDKGVGAALALLLVYLQIETMWDYRRETWLWVSLTVIAAAHFAAVWLIPYRIPRGPGLTWALPLVTIDGYVVWGALRWLANRLSPSRSSSASQPERTP
jgi:hypothetical protein